MNARDTIGMLGGAGLIALLAACQETPLAPPAPIVPPPAATTAPAPATTHSQTIMPPGPAVAAPVKMEKPRVLGPVAPAIVVVPPAMAEPVIRVRLTAEEDVPLVIDHHKYHGTVQTVQLPTGKYVAINTVAIEHYLAGVLAKELYGSWSLETYKCQAVAARTFALYQLRTASKDRLWDVNNDESSQMYGGIKGETARSRAAVAQTHGQVLTTTWKNQRGIFCTFYSSCAGGATQDPWEAWGDMPVGPLAARRVGAIDGNCPKFAWPTLELTKADLARSIAAWGQRNGVAYLATLGPIRSVQITRRNTVTGRPTEISLTSAAGRTVPIRAEEFRLALIYDPAGTAPKPPSSFFDVVDAGSGVWLTHGHGFGHGIGMSQWGAQAMALQGYSAGQILAFYYPGAVPATLW